MSSRPQDALVDPPRASIRNSGGLSGAISTLVERLLFRPVEIVGVEPWAARFHAIAMEGAALEAMKWAPGQTIQVFLGNLTKRAYTPVDVRSETGSALFLCYLHGNGPGSDWATSARAGDVCHVMRPKESIDFEKCTSPTIFFGDETSLSSVLALQRCVGESKNVRVVLEVDSSLDTQAVLHQLGIAGVQLVERNLDGSHLSEVVSALAQLAASADRPEWIFTGNARSIQAVRRDLRRLGILMETSKSRAYWSPGKKGLD